MSPRSSGLATPRNYYEQAIKRSILTPKTVRNSIEFSKNSFSHSRIVRAEHAFGGFSMPARPLRRRQHQTMSAAHLKLRGDRIMPKCVIEDVYPIQEI